MNKLSVIVPIYNSEKYLSACIDSICKQSYSDLQIILVNDGSSDKSGEICDEYAKKDKRITVIHQCNSGPLVARYKGVLNSDSEYVAFVDADDWIDEDAYQLFAEQMTKGIDLIVFGKIIEKQNVGSTYPPFLYDVGEYNREDIEKKVYSSMIWNFEEKQPGMTQSLNDKIFKRKLLLKSYELVQKMPNIHYGEDPMILYPTMQWITSMYVSKECPYHYRQNVNSVPAYMCNDDFFDKLYVWYKHMVDNTKFIPHVKKQIEYVYMHLIELRKEYYGDFVHNDEFLVPFDKIPAHSRIILYGAGKQGMTYYDQIKRINYCNVVAWIDKNYSQYEQYGVKNIDILKDEQSQFDYVVIAIYSDTIKNEVIQNLCEFGIEKCKIIS